VFFNAILLHRDSNNVFLHETRKNSCSLQAGFELPEFFQHPKPLHY